MKKLKPVVRAVAALTLGLGALGGLQQVTATDLHRPTVEDGSAGSRSTVSMPIWAAGAMDS
ncbi:hypothetical protein [Kitasatospora sp. NPDC093806]|uniref:hypothetical protein n=1 Tax=Kitasatospora sp. NPDC093806 TaxID=3155075 RepID=UPI00343FCA0C